jgi:DNA-binding winged helix-turn-helix (wHTH) protein
MATGPPLTQSGDSRRIVRFASFEFDPGTGELRKHGMRIKLQGQPVGVLAMLIERAGDIVSRDDLQKRLWPADTHVDFEHSLNAAIKRLRAALGDSADSPRFVETMPRQGYRFIAPIHQVASPIPVEVPAAEPEIPVVPPAAESTRNTRDRRVFVLLAMAAALAVAATLWLQTTEYFWRNPIAGAQFQTVTDFEGVAQAGISRDGKFVAFLSNHEGQVDVWVTQVGSGRYHNLTRGSAMDIVNESIRALGFSPDGAFVTFWSRRADGSETGHIGIWAVPTLGGEPRPYLDGVAEFDWARDGARLAYHTPSTGDPLFVSDGLPQTGARPIFIAPAGQHSHFPLWAPDAAWLYFVQGTLPDKLDIWRIRPTGGTPERITRHNGRVSHPILLDSRTLLSLAIDADGSGPWLYSVVVVRRLPHRLSAGAERYSSLAAAADGRRLVATLTSPKKTLWRLPLTDSLTGVPPAAKISLTTSAGFSPRLGGDFLLYVSDTGTSESIGK